MTGFLVQSFVCVSVHSDFIYLFLDFYPSFLPQTNMGPKVAILGCGGMLGSQKKQTRLAQPKNQYLTLLLAIKCMCVGIPFHLCKIKVAYS